MNLFRVISVSSDVPGEKTEKNTAFKNHFYLLIDTADPDRFCITLSSYHYSIYNEIEGYCNNHSDYYGNNIV